MQERIADAGIPAHQHQRAEAAFARREDAAHRGSITVPHIRQPRRRHGIVFYRRIGGAAKVHGILQPEGVGLLDGFDLGRIRPVRGRVDQDGSGAAAGQQQRFGQQALPVALAQCCQTMPAGCTTPVGITA